MEDPLSALHDRPHRYLLESDSSDEEGQGIYGAHESGPSSSSKPKINTSQGYTVEDVELTGESWDTYEEIVLGLGQAGRYLTRKMVGRGEDTVVEVKMQGQAVGSGWKAGRRLLLSLDEGEQHSLHVLARALLNKADRIPWVIISTYLPSLYIPDRAFSLPTAPVRYLDIEGDRIVDKAINGAERITSPNFVTGLSAALLSTLSRSSSTSATASLVLLPLPLSALPTAQFTDTLIALSTGETPFSPAQKGTAWTEDDDEPFEQAGMGMGKNKHHSRPSDKRADVKREVDGMYM